VSRDELCIPQASDERGIRACCPSKEPKRSLSCRVWSAAFDASTDACVMSKVKVGVYTYMGAAAGAVPLGVLVCLAGTGQDDSRDWRYLKALLPSKSRVTIPAGNTFSRRWSLTGAELCGAPNVNPPLTGVIPMRGV
jgi:hypothetical protein